MTSFQINSPGVSTKILLVVFAKLTLGLRIEDLSFPSHVMLGQSVTLSCEYSLDHSDEIDSIKWYRDNQEFYRIIQNQNFNEPERVSTFDRTGIKLDMQQSRVGYCEQIAGRNVFLQNVSPTIQLLQKQKYLCSHMFITIVEKRNA